MLTFSFNARLDPKTVRPDRLRVRPAPATLPSLHVIHNQTTGWSDISASVAWDPGVRYTVTLGSGIRTVDGASISNLPYTIRFTTSEPRRLDITPGGVEPGR